MEEDKKKKRNKKKRNKQNKIADNALTGAEQTASATKNQLSNGKEEHEELSDSVDAGSSNMDSNAHQTNETANESLEQRILFLERGLDSATQKEAMLETSIVKLRDENEAYLQKQKIQKLKDAIDMHVQRKVSLEETINQLGSENESHRGKQAVLEETINQSVLEEESLKKRIQFLERELDSSTTNENAAKETIAKLHIDVTRLQMQVVELEHSRSTLMLENQQLTGNALALQSTIENLDKRCSSLSSPKSRKDQISGDGDLNSELEAAFSLVEKLIIENAELVEKVTELYAKLDQQSEMAVHPDPISAAETAAKVFDVPDATPVEELESLEVVPIGNASDDNLDSKADQANPHSVSDSVEIVSIPLIENETRDTADNMHNNAEPAAFLMFENETQDTADNMDNNGEPVPLTDAPLIGAPFRMISFVAKYVSGADLVSKNSGH